jgi:hypothetical protein
MIGVDYGNQHANDSKFGIQVIGGPMIDFVDFGELGSRLRFHKTADGNEHPSGDTDTFEVTAKKYPSNLAQNAYMQAWLLECETAGFTATRAANFFKFGPGEVILETHYIGRISVSGYAPSGGNRESGGASVETWTFKVHKNRKVK